MKKIRHIIEAGFLGVILTIFRLLPLDAASNLGGWIGRMIGPKLGASKKARRHLRLALPYLSYTAQNVIIRDMWDNLGRVVAEYPHLEKIARERVTVVGSDNLNAMIVDGMPGIVFGAHLANWEVPMMWANISGLATDGLYRAPNNPYVDAMLERARAHDQGDIRHHAKSLGGMRGIIDALKEGRHIGILIDQKYNEGMLVPFFGHPAKTSDAFIQLARRFKCPLHPVRIERIRGANFRLTLHPAMEIGPDTEAAIIEAHAMLQEWIAEKPAQWLWLHNRWPAGTAV